MARILIVDDESEVRKPLRILLERQGHQVGEAQDGAQAAAFAEQGHYDLVITDVVMPRTGGIEAVMTLHRTHPEMGLIIMSGKIPTESESIQLLARQFGVTRILHKPFSKAELIDAVNTTLAHA